MFVYTSSVSQSWVRGDKVRVKALICLININFSRYILCSRLLKDRGEPYSIAIPLDISALHIYELNDQF